MTREGRVEHGGETVEEPRRPLVRLDDAIQIDVIPVLVGVDDGGGPRQRRELGGERGRVEIVHAEMARGPRTLVRVATTAVRCDQHERALARDDGDAPRGHVRLLAFRPPGVYTRRRC